MLLYLDCSSGVSGDMLLAALVDLGLPVERLEALAERLGIASELSLSAPLIDAGGFRARRLDIRARDGRKRQLPALLEALERSGSKAVVEGGRRTLERLADVESRLHGVPLDQLHLHELSGVDTLLDIAGFHFACAELGVERVAASAVNVGGGRVTFSHGTFGVPAPATAELLRGVPTYGDDETAGELTTPTGAAILVTAVTSFGPMPRLRVDRIGYAVGSRPHTPPRILRAMLGTLDPA